MRKAAPARATGATLPPARSEARAYAARALLLAGYALAPPKPSLADRRLAQLLLRECRKACGEAAGSPEAPLFALEAEEPPSAEALRALEEEFALRVKRLFGERNPRRVASWLALAFGVIALAGATWLLVAALMPRPEYESYLWKSSSGMAGFGREGTLSQHGISDLVFHTENEEHPWVVIDLLKTRKISQVILKNRADCCPDRGLPLVVEVGENGFTYTVVGMTANVFDVWKVDFSPRSARYVRIRSEATTVIQLRAVIVQ